MAREASELGVIALAAVSLQARDVICVPVHERDVALALAVGLILDQLERTGGRGHGVGLDALAIVAEIQAVLKNREGGFLREREGSIYGRS